MTGHICPECGTDSRPGVGPGCACAARPAHDGNAFAPQAAGPRHLSDEERAAEQQRIAAQHHAERSADIAAAEDFDPLRIRPYVTLGGEDTTTAATDPSRGHGHTPGGQPGDAATTMPLFLDPAGPGPLPDGTTAPGGAAGFSDDTALLTAGPDPVQPRRRRPFAALVAGAAVVTVVGTAAFVGGLFNGDRDHEADLDQALPSTVTSLPEETVEPSAPASASASPSPSRTTSGPPSASASATRSASPSATASASSSVSAPASASGPAAASSPAATAGSSDPAEVAPPAQPQGGPTLRIGDSGPEVVELQRRLQEVWALTDDSLSNDYTERVEKAVHDFQIWWNVQGDPDGVYGPHTRRRLESATTGQGRH
ncbi:peptidoglycan-binding protein [Streptomyces sp. NPDC048332]|uniref:peptidoglycan-binding domain-containing protein n=1 Tax=unclassified Streptomyces TaxID=2593676 RepID=UPI00341D0389